MCVCVCDFLYLGFSVKSTVWRHWPQSYNDGRIRAPPPILRTCVTHYSFATGLMKPYCWNRCWSLSITIFCLHATFIYCVRTILTANALSPRLHQIRRLNNGRAHLFSASNDWAVFREQTKNLSRVGFVVFSKIIIRWLKINNLRPSIKKKRRREINKM